MIENFREAKEQSTIDHVLDAAHPIFRLFGWTWFDGPPTRDRMEEMLHELTESALGQINETSEVQDGSCTSGRFTVNAHIENGGLSVEYGLELGTGHGE